MKATTVLAALILTAIALVACGSSENEGPGTTRGENQGTPRTVVEEQTAGGATIQVLNIEADPDGALAYIPDRVTAKPGKTKINFDNRSSYTHDLVIEDSSGKEIARDELVQEGSTTDSAKLKPGTYTYYCSVPEHRAGGMVGTLVVK